MHIHEILGNIRIVVLNSHKFAIRISDSMNDAPAQGSIRMWKMPTRSDIGHRVQFGKSVRRIEPLPGSSDKYSNISISLECTPWQQLFQYLFPNRNLHVFQRWPFRKLPLWPFVKKVSQGFVFIFTSLFDIHVSCYCWIYPVNAFPEIFFCNRAIPHVNFLVQQSFYNISVLVRPEE